MCTAAPYRTADRNDVTGQHGVDLQAGNGVEGSCGPKIDQGQGAGEHKSEDERVKGDVPTRPDCREPCAEREAPVSGKRIQLTGACGDKSQ